MNKNLVSTFLCGIGVLGVLVFFFPFLMIPWGIFQISRMERAMSKPVVYQPAARLLARYCQSDRNLFPERMNATWLPPELSRITGGRGDVIARSDEGYFGFGSGFYHWGFALRRDPDASTPDTNFWRLYQTADTGKRDELETFTLPVSDRFTAKTLLAHLRPTLDASIAAKPRDGRRYMTKARILLHLDRLPEARQTARDFLQARPNEWHAVLLNAFLTAAEKSPAEGAAEVEAWVKRGESFDRYTDLAYYNFVAGRPAEAAAALTRATTFRPPFLGGEGFNAPHRGYTLAFCAYRTGEYAAALAVCKQLLALRENHLRAEFTTLQTACEKALAGYPGDISWPDPDDSPFSPFASGDGYGVDLDKLTGRKLLLPTKENMGSWPFQKW